MQTIAVIGGGLAGCEAAWQAARFGVRVALFEMKPGRFSPAHKSRGLAELVCSNSFRSTEPETAVGLLKQEMSAAGSLVMVAANQTRVPAGKALAVDRERFSALITQKIQEHPLIRVVQKEAASLDDPELEAFDAVVVAAGPLASEPLARSLSRALGQESLYFYDAIAPIVAAESVNMDRAFWASRYKPDQHDYLNCPMTEREYLDFVEALLAADKVKAREFEDQAHFEGCLPIETMAERGTMTLAYGPMKPVGLTDPKTGERPFAVVQLRPENLDKTMLGLVGFQTKLTYPEQKRVFRMIPCLAGAEFARLGSMHRNTFVNAPRVLTPELMLKTRPGFYLAGQITGVEGYVESAACGMWLGLYLGAKFTGREVSLPPVESALGALLAHLRTEAKNFQPSNVNFGLTPPLNRRAGKIKRKYMYAERAEKAFGRWLEEGPLPEPGP